jgi:hypothetical protein
MVTPSISNDGSPAEPALDDSRPPIFGAWTRDSRIRTEPAPEPPGLPATLDEAPSDTSSPPAPTAEGAARSGRRLDLRPSRPVAPTCRPLAAIRRDPPPVTSAADAALIAILEAPLAWGETLRDGFDRKEREFAFACAALPPSDARTLQTRLANPGAGDALAARFARLTAERRERLLDFLADARRREALAATFRRKG